MDSVYAIPDNILFLILGIFILIIIILLTVMVAGKNKRVEYYYKDEYGNDGNASGLQDQGIAVKDSRDGHTVLSSPAAGKSLSDDRPILVTLRGKGGSGNLYQFSVADDHVTIGRNRSKCQVVINGDNSISGLHCEMFLKNGSLMLKDKGSTNGTWVGEQKITDLTAVHSGDQIKMGSSVFRLEIH